MNRDRVRVLLRELLAELDSEPDDELARQPQHWISTRKTAERSR
jgi:hypothetical protein